MEGRDTERSVLESWRCVPLCVGFRSDLRRQPEQPNSTGHQRGLLVHVLAHMTTTPALAFILFLFFFAIELVR